MPKISIVTPVLNGGKKFRKCIDSVLRQTFKDFEWIIVDDNSSDITKELLDRLYTLDKRVKILRNRTICGASFSRGKGVEACSGEYITFLDADDSYTPHALERYMDATKRRAADIYIIGSKLALPFGLKHRYYSCEREKNFCSGYMDGKQGCLLVLANKGLTPQLWDKMYSTAFFKSNIKAFPELKIGEDFVANIRLMANANLICAVQGTGYLWSYTGMGEKYYLDNWENYKTAMTYALREVNNLDWDTDHIDMAYKALYTNYMGHINESIVRRRLHGEPEDSTIAFILESLDHKIITSTQPFMAETPSAQDIIESAIRHLREHRKYYIFTRIINRFLKL